jgi:hypothetical protein
MSGEAKVLIFVGVCAATVIGGFAVDDYIRRKQDLQKKISDNELELKKAELEGTYPPEYWTAKAAEAEADARVRQARIESEERLQLDARDRAEKEKEALRKFEQNAPAEYWEQKKFEEEEKTKRESDKRRFEAEQEAAKLHNKAIEESAKAAERAIRRSIGSYSGYNYI